MLQTIDTLIAFIVIMTVVSLLVVQMVSAALSLRGKNLANALAIASLTPSSPPAC